ncbi:hypothetical protein GTY81_19805 [Streptomyces sp. SID8366]|uniref:hypothetical protein n=1 Tax=unclassified Streptomyces TaxID=2593676 RepID=UPI000DB91AC6|nr:MULTISPECIES: hypothetical protein [unclassified Streptomyces]MYU06082.1 hypothetical protein [Streptomyces sp. SID8366]MYU68042.1 hypothetical protein [Streptomyces sp. SID69]
MTYFSPFFVMGDLFLFALIWRFGPDEHRSMAPWAFRGLTLLALLAAAPVFPLLNQAMGDRQGLVTILLSVLSAPTLGLSMLIRRRSTAGQSLLAAKIFIPASVFLCIAITAMPSARDHVSLMVYLSTCILIAQVVYIFLLYAYRAPNT